MLTFPAKDRGKIQGPVSINDVTAAFDYYINHYNKGKPFILAAHSQGTVMLQLLLSQYMAEHPDVYTRMIAAYAIGYPVTADYLSNNKHLKFAEGPDGTGVIISYNTQSPNIKKKATFSGWLEQDREDILSLRFIQSQLHPVLQELKKYNQLTDLRYHH
jgi:pimeloyl-ACP methyl ester carboxylesterase